MLYKKYLLKNKIIITNNFKLFLKNKYHGKNHPYYTIFLIHLHYGVKFLYYVQKIKILSTFSENTFLNKNDYSI